MICIIGLGNPGLKYKNTRHNAGFRVADLLAKEYGIKWKASKFEARIGQGLLDEKKILLVKPTTFMNHSGLAVSAVMDYFNIALKDIVVMYDDMDLPLGSVRIRERGSAGGHNGLKSIISYCKSEEFARLRIGIGKPEGQKGTIPHVLGKFRGDEGVIAQDIFDKCTQAVSCIIKEGIQMAQSKYNG